MFKVFDQVSGNDKYSRIIILEFLRKWRKHFSLTDENLRLKKNCDIISVLQ